MLNVKQTFIKLLCKIKGEEYEINKNELSFFYRGCSLAENLVIVSARFNGKKLNKNPYSSEKKQIDQGSVR